MDGTKAALIPKLTSPLLSSCLQWPHEQKLLQKDQPQSLKQLYSMTSYRSSTTSSASDGSYRLFIEDTQPSQSFDNLHTLEWQESQSSIHSNSTIQGHSSGRGSTTNPPLDFSSVSFHSLLSTSISSLKLMQDTSPCSSGLANNSGVAPQISCNSKGKQKDREVPSSIDWNHRPPETMFTFSSLPPFPNIPPPPPPTAGPSQPSPPGDPSPAPFGQPASSDNEMASVMMWFSNGLSHLATTVEAAVKE
ncbi:hypothetical protein BD769DRAFT_1664887 [Suillus cothurnatus]|nr:hypothetical protein BD769DRAFT_1664887 [Suillus cothurnatus]